MRIGIYLWGIVPLCLGVGTLGKWVMTRQHGLELVGLGVIALGVFATIGFVTDIVVSIKRDRRAGHAASVRQFRFLLPTLLMVLNYPVAFGCIATYNFICSRAYVRIQNRSGAPIDEIVLSGSRQRKDLGNLPHGATRSSFFLPKGDSGLVLSARKGMTTTNYVVSSYLMPESGKEAYEVEIGPGLQVKSREVFR